MEKDDSAKLNWSRTHFIDRHNKRKVSDRRKQHCFVENDRRSGIACRRREAQRQKEMRNAENKEVYNPYFKID